MIMPMGYDSERIEGGRRIQCDYCRVYNQYGKETCECCGAPLDYKEPDLIFFNWGITNSSSPIKQY